MEYGNVNTKYKTSNVQALRNEINKRNKIKSSSLYQNHTPTVILKIT